MTLETYFKDLHNEGAGEDTSGRLLSFTIDDIDVERFPILAKYETIHLFMDDEGNVENVFLD